MNIKVVFSRFAAWSAKQTGSAYFFGALIALTLIWLAFGPLTKYSDAWQLICNTGSTILTTLLVVLIQHTQNRDTLAINMKLDELIKAKRNADNRMIGIEELTEEELERLRSIAASREAYRAGENS